MEFTPKKLYYKSGEVCKIVGVEAHVLRYWETEFPSVAPPKNRGGQRTYRPRDIELLLRIRQLLYEEGFTIAGARKRLSQPEPGGEPAAAKTLRAIPGSGGRRRKRKVSGERFSKVREELENILTLLDREC